MGLPGYRLSGFIDFIDLTHFRCTCLGSSKPERVVKGSLSLLLCSRCGGIVTHPPRGGVTPDSD